MAYGTQYGQLYGSTQSTDNPEEPTMTLLEQNDEFVLNGTTLKATHQTDGLNLYIHITAQGSLIVLQPNHEGSTEYQIVEIKSEGIALLNEVLNGQS